MCMASLSSCTQRLAGRCGVSPLEEVRKDYRLSAGGDFPLPHNKTNVRYISMNGNFETTANVKTSAGAGAETSQTVETSAGAENSKRAENVETSAGAKTSQAVETSAGAENSKRAENVENSAGVKASRAVETSALTETVASVEYDTANIEYLFTCQLFFDALFVGCFVAYVFWKEIIKR